MNFLVSVFLVAFAFVAADESLVGSKVFDVHPQTENDFTAMRSLEEQVEGLDFWQHAHFLGREARVLVPKASQLHFETFLSNAGIKYEVFMDDVEAVLSREMYRNDIARSISPRDGRISFTAYHRHTEINTYMDALEAKYPKTVKVQTLGKSSQGRDLKAIRISTTGGTDTKKPIVVVDAGIHAREWIAPAMALYMITKLVEDITENDIVDEIDWIIIPLLNPDGYEYSQDNTRLWRKTRSTVASTLCPGADGNRNFEYKWMESGASSSACSDIFAGKKPFSEPETGYLRDILLENVGRTKLYLAIHSYGSYFLYPYGYDGSPTPNEDELYTLGLKVAKAIEAESPSSKKYLVGNSAVALNYMAAGASDDYAYAIGKSPLAYTLELPAGGNSGFDPPPNKIQGIVKETWPGIVVLARYIIENK